MHENVDIEKKIQPVKLYRTPNNFLLALRSLKDVIN